jgi:hypothetical protein
MGPQRSAEEAIVRGELGMIGTNRQGLEHDLDGEDIIFIRYDLPPGQR